MTAEKITILTWSMRRRKVKARLKMINMRIVTVSILVMNHCMDTTCRHVPLKLSTTACSDIVTNQAIDLIVYIKKTQ